MTSRSTHLVVAQIAFLIAASWPAVTRAQDEGVAEGGRQERVVTAATGAGAFLPFASAATLDQQRATVGTFGGYDSTRKTALFEAAAEVRLWRGLSLRGGGLYTASTDTLRPSFGARYQFLSEGRHGIDGSLGVFYRPEGLTEPEGEIETVVSVGSHLGGNYLLGNLVYGQDPEANERDGEVRLAAVRPLGSRVFLGLDSRLRFDLGSKPTKLEAKLDAVVGPVAAVLLGPVALTLQGGASALRLKDTTSYGAVVLGGLGSAF